MKKNHDLLTAPVQRTLSDYITTELRQAILTNQLKPNQRLVEKELAESMNTSRGPVREALRSLENEGLVNRHTHRGTFVNPLTKEDALEIFTLREALEILAIKFATKNASDEDIDKLVQLTEAMDKLSRQPEYDQLVATELDLEFHHTICIASRHSRLLTAWENIRSQLQLLILKHRYTNPQDLTTRGVIWHEDIVKALKKPR